MRTASLLVVSLAVASGAVGARAIAEPAPRPPEQGAEPAGGSPGAPAEPSAPLGGPKVNDPHGSGGAGGSGGGGATTGGPGAGARATLVELDFQGRLKKLDVRPEEAALDLLGLSDDERAAAERVLEARAAQLDALVRENLELLLQMRSARASGNRADMTRLGNELKTVLAPLADGGGLLAQLQAALPPEKGARLRSLVSEYTQALLDEPVGDPIAANPEKSGGTQNRRTMPGQGQPGAMARVTGEWLGLEIRRSYDRIASDGNQRLEAAIGALGLTPEQEGKIRGLAADFAQKTKLNPSRADRLDLFASIMLELTPEQKAAFIKHLREQGAR